MIDHEPGRERPWRLPDPAVFAVASILLLLAAHHWKVLDHWKEAGPDRLAAVVPPFWRLSGRALAGHVLSLAKLFWISLVFVGSGRALAGAWRLSFHNAWERAAVSFCLGAGAWAYLFFLLGALGLLHRPLLMALLVLGVLPAFWRSRDRSAHPAIASDPWTRISGVILLFHVCVLFTFALVPETFYDALVYHLGLPKLYLLRHAIGAVPDNAFSGVPSVPSMLFGWALALDPNSIVAHLLNFSFLPWSAAALIGLAARLGRPGAGVVAGMLFCTVPIVGSASFMTTVELPWAFFQFICVQALIAAMDEERASEQRRKWLIVAGCCFGLAMATKYLAWALPAAVLAFALAARRSGTPFERRELAVVGLLGCALLSPWIVKNLAHYRNPIFPFLHEFFDPSSEIMPSWRYLGSGATISWSSLGPVGGLRQYASGLGRLMTFGTVGESAGPVLLALTPLLLLARLEPRERLLAWFTLGCWLPLSLIVLLPRYFVPAMLPLSLLAALVVSRGESKMKGALAGAVCAACLAASWCFLRWGTPRRHWDAFAGRKSAAEHLSYSDHYYPAPLFPAAEYLATHAPDKVRVLLFGDSRGFQLPRDHVASTPGQATILERLANRSSSGRDLKARLDAERISYIVVNHAEIVRQKLVLRFSQRGKKNIDDFWKHYTLKVFQAGPDGPVVDGKMVLDRWVVVYKVLTDQESLRPHPSDDLFGSYVRAGP